ncbi:hypothetical protein C7379_104113 [Hallella colorans]|uniref:Uncharacterized protein n=1 Tax=Hallella colorans TaxID=1703337 RepID=A0A2U0UIP5_9BACT|nr:hypothetical protein C7379_104113 [Hallella colorans]
MYYKYERFNISGYGCMLFWADWHEGIECSNVAKNMATHDGFLRKKPAYFSNILSEQGLWSKIITL